MDIQHFSTPEKSEKDGDSKRKYQGERRTMGFRGLESLKFTRREFLILIIGMILGGVLDQHFSNLLKKLKDLLRKRGKRIGELEKLKNELEILLESLQKIEKNLSNIEKNNEPIELSKEKREELEEIEQLLKTKLQLSPLTEAYLENNPLEKLWSVKIERASKNGRNLENLKDQILKEYETEPRGYLNLENFEKYIKYCILQTLKILDFKSLLANQRTNLDQARQKLFFELITNEKFQETLKRILLNIIVVEICHIFEDEPEKNIRVLNYLLNKYGLRFICSIPSIYDSMISFGPFQITELIMGKEKGLFYPINFMNNFIIKLEREKREKYNLPDYALPASLENVRLRQHFTAEILLLTYYLIKLFQEVDVQTLNECLNNQDWFFTQLAYYCAGCHHLPYKTIDNFKKFLSSQVRAKKSGGFIEYLNQKKTNSELKVYLERFRKHFKFQNKNT